MITEEGKLHQIRSDVLGAMSILLCVYRDGDKPRPGFDKMDPYLAAVEAHRKLSSAISKLYDIGIHADSQADYLFGKR